MRVRAVETTTPEMSATARPWKIGSRRMTPPPDDEGEGGQDDRPEADGARP